MRIAVPRVTNVKSAQGMARTTQPSHRFVQSAADGERERHRERREAENMTGGWMTIHGSCRSGFRPWPSGGICGEEAEGRLLDEDGDDPDERREVDRP